MRQQVARLAALTQVLDELPAHLREAFLLYTVCHFGFDSVAR